MFFYLITAVPTLLNFKHGGSTSWGFQLKLIFFWIFRFLWISRFLLLQIIVVNSYLMWAVVIVCTFQLIWYRSTNFLCTYLTFVTFCIALKEVYTEFIPYAWTPIVLIF